MIKPCVQREKTETGYLCHSPKVISLGEIDGRICDRCPYRDESKEDFFRATKKLTKWSRPKNPPKPCGGCPDTESRKALNVKMRDIADNGDWTVAITTAPRRDCTLQRCVDSVRNAGWEPIIFAEPGSTKTDAQTFENPERKGVWHNWRDSCGWVLRNTKSQLILTVQDDSFFHPDSRTFAESILWPAKNAAFVSLYTPKHYTLNGAKEYRPAGVNRIKTRSLWGACALIWDRRVLEAVVYHKIAKSWVGAARNNKQRKQFLQRPKYKTANSDTAIGKICNALRRPMYFVDPSPVSHIAVHSSIGHGDNKGRRNCYRCADPNTPLIDQIPTNQKTHRLGAS